MDTEPAAILSILGLAQPGIVGHQVSAGTLLRLCARVRVRVLVCWCVGVFVCVSTQSYGHELEPRLRRLRMHVAKITFLCRVVGVTRRHI